jgi:hypothetical protein
MYLNFAIRRCVARSDTCTIYSSENMAFITTAMVWSQTQRGCLHRYLFAFVHVCRLCACMYVQRWNVCGGSGNRESTVIAVKVYAVPYVEDLIQMRHVSYSSSVDAPQELNIVWHDFLSTGATRLWHEWPLIICCGVHGMVPVSPPLLYS